MDWSALHNIAAIVSIAGSAISALFALWVKGFMAQQKLEEREHTEKKIAEAVTPLGERISYLERMRIEAKRS